MILFEAIAHGQADGKPYIEQRELVVQHPSIVENIHDVEQSITVFGTRPGDVAFRVIAADCNYILDALYFVTGQEQQYGEIVPQDLLMRDPGTHGTRLLANKLRTAPQIVHELGAQSLAKQLKRHYSELTS